MNASSSSDQVVSTHEIEGLQLNKMNYLPCKFVSDSTRASRGADPPLIDKPGKGLDFAAAPRCFRWPAEVECRPMLATGIETFADEEGHMRHRASPSFTLNSKTLHHSVSHANREH